MENEKRLIDANALKSEFEWLKSVVNESSKDEVMDVMQRIDNAPHRGCRRGYPVQGLQEQRLFRML